MITPTIGRVIWYNDGRSDQRVPAFITYVHSNECINIAGFLHTGEPFSRSSVHLCQESKQGVSQECTVGLAEWMPYQKEQQVKQDAKCDPADPTDPLA